MDEIIVFYFNNMTLFTKERSSHFDHLRQVLQICQKFGIFLNSKKTIFCVTQGIILGQVVSQLSVKFDLKRVIKIKRLPQLGGISSLFFILALTLSIMLEVSTRRVIVLPINIMTKMVVSTRRVIVLQINILTKMSIPPWG